MFMRTHRQDFETTVSWLSDNDHAEGHSKAAEVGDGDDLP